jgi:hypothetical protein
MQTHVDDEKMAVSSSRLSPVKVKLINRLYSSTS